jgi:hypothetical protein
MKTIIIVYLPMYVYIHTDQVDDGCAIREKEEERE